MIERHLSTRASDGYELLDSGDHLKLERYGDYVLARPDTQAIWRKSDASLWEKAAAVFSRDGAKGAWEKNGDLPDMWDVSFGSMTLSTRLTSFKHTGIFPEQSPNWEWTAGKIQALKEPQILNLFGYTGAASIAAAQAGAQVTHVDSSKSSVTWAKENAERSGVPEGAIRYIVEDARSFVKREIRRGAKYEGILLDPPAFGRGAKDEVWKIEEDLLPLIELLKELLSDAPGSFFLLNGYAAGYAPQSFLQLVESVFGTVDAEYGELRIEEKSGRLLPSGMYVRFSL
ncbi:MAG TPA: class I SAM-dependent methyltransferase [Candidatus Paceibacterota bacterium]|nr:class I SAM-dependent methyltransferase [Candidatus Paceibacterota bacterium]